VWRYSSTRTCEAFLDYLLEKKNRVIWVRWANGNCASCLRTTRWSERGRRVVLTSEPGLCGSSLPAVPRREIDWKAFPAATAP
jgi:hypothetical protein